MSRLLLTDPTPIRALIDTLDGTRPLTRDARAATAEDVAKIRHRMLLATDLYRSVILELSKSLNENLARGRFETDSVFSLLDAARAEIAAQLVDIGGDQ